MKEVKIINKQLQINKEKLNLLSGEVHYWRLFPEAWDKILDTVKELGLKIVSTYVPWHYHEISKGNLDFEGKTSENRNLLRFIKLVKEKNMWLILRPGPYLYTEWVNRGVPDYMIKYHRNHEEFKKLSSVYIKHICKIIKPFLASQNGPIIMVQADNEIDMWSKTYEQQLGLLSTPGAFQEFLKKKYKNIEKLNQNWNVQLKDFSEAKPITQNIVEDEYYKKRFFDFCEFRHDYGLSIAAWAVQQYKDNYIDVPVYLNAYPWVDSQHWREFQNKSDIFGIDIYPVNEYRGSVSEQRTNMDCVRYTRTFAQIPYIAEFECGVWHEMHYVNNVLKPNHYRLICLSMLQAGVAGWNWYMLVNRDNWYMCPINEWGRKRNELFSVFKEIVSLYNEFNPSQCEKITDSAVSYNILQAGVQVSKLDNSVLNSLYQADIDYEFFDMETKKISKKILFYANEYYLSKKEQNNLLNYVEAGGNLVIFQNFPRKDENFKPLNLLEIKEPDRILDPIKIEFSLGDEKCFVISPLFVYDQVPGIPINGKSSVFFTHSLEEEKGFENLEEGREYCLGYVQEKGKGKILVLGVQPNPDLMLSIHKYLKVENPSQCLTPGVISSVFSYEKDYFLILTNNSDDSKHVKVMLNKNIFNKNKYNIINLLTKEKEIVTNINFIAVFIAKKDGVIIKIQDEEL